MAGSEDGCYPTERLDPYMKGTCQLHVPAILPDRRWSSCQPIAIPLIKATLFHGTGRFPEQSLRPTTSICVIACDPKVSFNDHIKVN
jgi:hypothetical protein